MKENIKKTIIGIVMVLFVLVGCSSFLVENTEDYREQKTDWVFDQTGYLSQETLDYITELNEEVFVQYDLEPQYAVEVMVELPEDNRNIDSYRSERFEELGVGHKEKDSGVLLVVDLDGREVGIEVGYGIEDVIRDIEAGNIIDGEMNEYLGNFMRTKDSEYLNKAIVQASEEINTLLEKADTGLLFEERAEEEKITFWDALFYIFLIIILVVLIGLSEGGSGGYYSGSSSSSYGGGFGGGRSGGGGASGGF